MQLNKRTMLTVAMAAFSLAANAQTMTADQIVKKHIEAIGGADNWTKVTSLKKTGTLTMQGMGIEVTTSILNGKGVRQDMNIMGISNYVIMTPTGGWTYFPVQQDTEPKALSADDVKGGLDQMNTQEEFMTWQANGAKFSGGKTEKVDSADYIRLNVVSKSGDSTIVYLDPATYYTYKTKTSVSGPDGVTEISTIYTDYKKLPEGIVVAMTVNSAALGGKTVYKTIEVNTIKDDKIFQKQ